MPFHTPHITTALVAPDTVLKTQKGKAFVERQISSNIYSLRVANSSIAVKVSDNSLIPGETVFFTKHDDHLVIEKLFHTRSPAIDQVDIAASLCKHELELTDKTTKTNSSNLIALVSIPQEGFYYAHSKDEALQILTLYSGADSSSLISEKLRQFGENVPLYIRFIQAPSGVPSAYVASRDDAVIEIEHYVRTEMKSDSMKNLPPAMITDFIAQRESVSLEELHRIDTVLAKGAANTTAAPLDSDALRISWMQLAHLILDTQIDLTPFVSAITQIASKLPEDFQNIVSELFKRNYTDSDLGFDPSILIDSVTDQQQINQEFISNLFRILGFSLEHDIAVESDEFFMSSETLPVKQALLSLLHFLQTSQSVNSNTVSGFAVNNDIVSGIYFLQNLEALSSLLKNSELDAETIPISGQQEQGILLKVTSVPDSENNGVILPFHRIDQQISSLLQTARSTILKTVDPGIFTGILLQHGSVAFRDFESLDAILHHAQQNGVNLDSLFKTFNVSWEKLIPYVFNSNDSFYSDLEEVLKSIYNTTHDGIENSAGSMGGKGNNPEIEQFKNVFLEKSMAFSFGKQDEIVTSFLKNIDKLLKTNEMLSNQQQFSALAKQSPGFKAALLFFIGCCVDSAGQTPVLKHHQILLQTFAEFIENGGYRTSSNEKEPESSQTTTAQLHQQIEKVLNRVESLQLLAKPVSTTEGEQQVLALPITLGNERTEVRIKLVKRFRKNKNSNKRGPFTVELHAHLTKLGEITAHINYELKKRITISLTCGNKQIQSRLKHASNELFEKLIAIGLPPVHLELTTQSSSPEKGSTQKTTLKQHKLDIIG